MNKLFIEIGFENLPIKSNEIIIKNFIKFLKILFNKEKLYFKTIKIFTTARRIAIQINNINNNFFNQKYKKKYIQNLIKIAIKLLLTNISGFKQMRWGKNNYKFIRPINWFIVLFNNKIIKIKLFNLLSNRKSYGHILHYNNYIPLKNSNEYLFKLKFPGYVLVNFNNRREIIRNMIVYIANKTNCLVNIDENILINITNLVEWPIAIVINFNKIFNKIPKEILIFIIKYKQTSFNLFNKNNIITNKYIMIVNLNTLNKQKLILLNERNINNVFNDILFFLLYDLNKKLYERFKALELVIFQYKLGTLADKTRRIINNIKKYIIYIGGNIQIAIRAGYLSKCDFITYFVKEFNLFKGFIGSYYSFLNKEKKEIYKTIYQQYLPNKYNTILPYTKEGIALSLSNKLDDLIGFFYIGYKPIHSKDMFFTRRLAYIILKIIIFNESNVDLLLLINYSIDQYKNILKNNKFIKDILLFILDKLLILINKLNIKKNIYCSIQNTSFCPYDLFRRIYIMNYLLNKNILIYKIIEINKRIINFIKKYKKLYNNNLVIINKFNIRFFKQSIEYNVFNSIVFFIHNYTKVIEKGNCNYKEIYYIIYTLYNKINIYITNIQIFKTNINVSKNNVLILLYIHNIFIHLADFIGLVGLEPTTKGL
ncbi:Glycine--tRNA ligase beta subunit [Candidatus Portiera aleyrodidarum]|uniref:Glycine--tRNA ligase beta subunit n=1 Tax=Candidatus Portiera aleyrodidarum TV TaxID=1297582 RepID=A0A8D4BUC5_9GAMM|nr:glycine--tRNA ligase subunit beta [Candidatus Portiera aleyrodidarum]AGI27243.1 glycyl-tRNA synthetase beta chain [Candidatus Portiera aleyrodidarum TV]CEI59235.1 Glycine--tRNA ligase beta subunit [Candidatus Portiera aleyrodidarum]